VVSQFRVVCGTFKAMECGMRAMVWTFVIAFVIGGVGSLGCGSVTAKQPDAGTDAATPPGVCTANSLSCGSDAALYQCDGDGNALTKIQDCQYGCAVDHCKECAAGTSFCDGDNLVMCSADGMIVNPQSCAHGCQGNRCNTCDPGVAYCDGANAVTCGQDGMPASTMSCGTVGCAGGVCNQCVANTTSCQGDTLVTCSANGTVSSTTSCALGCSTSGTAHCKALVPSYGVSAPSGTLPNLVVDQDGTLDITNCSAAPSSVNLTIGMTTTSIVGSPQVAVVNQSGAPPICVVRFGTIDIMSGKTLTIVNSANPGHVLSLQATADITINGGMRFVSNAPGPAPGTSVAAIGTNANNKTCAPGAGGAGAARAGGAGGVCFQCSSGANVAGGAGGPAVTTILTRLTGGSAGGNVTDGSSTPGIGGKGGGALQLVSLTRVTIGATGSIALNGTGGLGTGTLFSYNLPAGGAGSGGTLVIEAPALSLSTGGLAVANGGGGAGGCGYCENSGGIFICGHYNGQPGQLSAVGAAGGYCTGLLQGHGGGEATGMYSADGATSDGACANVAGGAGGGSNGFVILRGRSTSTVMIATGAIVSPMPTLGAVTAN
jgi:hypothetical protein